MSDQLVCFYQKSPDGLFAERIRTLRAFLLHRRHLANSLLLTSCWPGEGKSTVCLNLAVALSEFGMKVLLVDANLRHATLTSQLNKRCPRREAQGCFESESDGQGSVGSFFDRPEELSFLPGVEFLSALGSGREDPAVALTSWTERISGLLAAYDFVLTDSACLSVCKDAYFTRGWTRHALVVVDPLRFRGADEGHLIEDLRDQGFEVLGSIVSRVPQS